MTDKSKKRRRHGNVLLTIMFLLGSLIALYPFYVGAVNHFIDQQRIKQLDQSTNRAIRQKEKVMAAKNVEIAKDGLHPGNDPFLGSSYQQQVSLKQHLIGSIAIPKIHLDIPLFDVTNDETLNYGAAVLQGTSYPLGGLGRHTVISGHRGLASRTLFTNIDRLKKGDIFVLTVLNKKLAYKVFRFQVVLPDNYTGLKIEKGRDLATLLTCTPYMINSHRLLITGYRVPYTAAIKKAVGQSDQAGSRDQLLILLAVLLFLALQIIVILRRILAWRLSKKSFDLRLTRLDRTGRPIEKAHFQLFSRNKKRPLQQLGKPILAVTNASGQLRFDQIPGGLYYLKQLDDPAANTGVLVGVKKIRQQQMRFYPRKRPLTDRNYINQTDQLVIQDS